MNQARARKLQHFTSDIFFSQPEAAPGLRRYSSSTDLSLLAIRSNSVDSFNSPSAKRLSRNKSSTFVNLCFHSDNCRGISPTRSVHEAVNDAENTSRVVNVLSKAPESPKVLISARRVSTDGPWILTTQDKTLPNYTAIQRIKPLDHGQMKWYDARTEVIPRGSRSFSPQVRKLKQLKGSWSIADGGLSSTRGTYKAYGPTTRRQVYRNDLSVAKAR